MGAQELSCHLCMSSPCQNQRLQALRLLAKSLQALKLPTTSVCNPSMASVTCEHESRLAIALQVRVSTSFHQHTCNRQAALVTCSPSGCLASPCRHGFQEQVCNEPSLLVKSLSAPASRSKRAIAKWPLRHASMRAVSPSWCPK